MTQPTPQPESPQNPAPPSQSVPSGSPSTEAVNLHNYLKMVDPAQEGVGLDKVRPIYPKIGWNVILGHCAELETANMLTKRKVSGPNGRGGYELYTWQ